MSLRIFVYGTLRRACATGAHDKYLAGALFVSNAKLQAKLFRIRYYPAIVLTQENSWVEGEVYELKDDAQLALLDEYEECKIPAVADQEYIREIVDVVLVSGAKLPVWTYIYNRSVESLEQIISGNFLKA